MSKFNFNTMKDEELKEAHLCIQHVIASMKYIEDMDEQLEALESCEIELSKRGIKEND